MKRVILLALLGFLAPGCRPDRGEPLGCYITASNTTDIASGGSVDICTTGCEELYYRFAILMEGTRCLCGSSPGGAPADPALCNIPCPRNSSQICGGRALGSAYDTGVLVPGPPTDIRIANITDTTVRIRWEPPLARSPLTGYRITAAVIFSPAIDALPPLEWTFSNNTLQTELLNLHPGTSYNVSVSATSVHGPGAATHSAVETDIGEPDPAPPAVTVIARHATHVVVRIPPAVNVNGPVSKYRVVVMEGERQQNFMAESLKAYHEAIEDGLPYYIAAELDPEEAMRDFTVGDGHNRNGYYNAPLRHTQDVQISLGVVSSKKGITRVRYTHASNVVVLNVSEEEPASSLVLILGVAVAVGIVLIFVGLGAIIILRRKVGTYRRQRLSQSMPLSGPCVEIENAGFIPDEEERVDHYGNLKRQLWNIPRNFLEVDAGSSIGVGAFGKFVRGRVQHRGGLRPALVQSVADGELSRNDKKLMLGELDLLIKSNGHDNVLSLIGICEIPDTLYVVLEDSRRSLKDLTLSSRHRDVQNDKFCTISEKNVLKIALDAAKGMEYLAAKKILHRRLCCRNVVIADGTTPKIGGFGLSHLHREGEKPDYTRWTAQEMFKQNSFATKSDVWSFGCLLWELMALGGTPYAHVANRDVAARVTRGVRPAQLPYVGDDLYQLCLHCWQLDLDERPPFSEVVQTLTSLSEQDVSGILNFTFYSGFQYESHNPELEMYN